MNTIGMLVVAALAARVGDDPAVTITVHLKLGQISRQRWQSVSLVSRPVIFDYQIAAFNVAGLAQTSPEAGQPNGVGLWRPKIKYPTTGVARCCARAASGHATPPRRRGA